MPKDALWTHGIGESLFHASTPSPHLPFFQDEIRLGLNLWDVHYLQELLSTFRIRFCNSFKLPFIFFFNPELDFG